MTSEDDLRTLQQASQGATDDEEFVHFALARLERVTVSPQLARKVATIPVHHPREQAWTWRSLWQPALVLGLSSVMGVLSGTWKADSEGEPQARQVQTASSGAGIDELWLDAWDLAWGSAYTASEDGWGVREVDELDAIASQAARGEATSSTQADGSVLDAKVLDAKVLDAKVLDAKVLDAKEQGPDDQDAKARRAAASDSAEGVRP